MTNFVATPRNYLPFFDSWNEGFGQHFPCFVPVIHRHTNHQDLFHHVRAGTTCKKDDRSNSCSSADEAVCNARIASAHQAYDQQRLQEAIMDLLQRKMCNMHLKLYADSSKSVRLHGWAWKLARMLLLSTYDPDGHDVLKFDERACVGRGRRSRVAEARAGAEASQWHLASASKPKHFRKRKRDDHDQGDGLERLATDRPMTAQRIAHENVLGRDGKAAVCQRSSSSDAASSENLDWNSFIALWQTRLSFKTSTGSTSQRVQSRDQKQKKAPPKHAKPLTVTYPFRVLHGLRPDRAVALANR
ncbi:hypothetical protein AC578_1471 [Pseudocercospora eumusae]|uniref:Uncharacterized protein n=1 Tax=Pseudocercospora eumusae TaxID=321146 RepID=A0A139H6M2_9PEZI|nr:hypothetical protein AC578_1471 [Pseudocercospora eumusae]